MARQRGGGWDDSEDIFGPNYETAKPQYQQTKSPGQAAAEGGLAGASSGNAAVAGGMAGLAFLSAQQARKQAERQNQYEAKKYGATASADLMNSALDRYMKAVS